MDGENIKTVFSSWHRNVQFAVTLQLERPQKDDYTVAKCPHTSALNLSKCPVVETEVIVSHVTIEIWVFRALNSRKTKLLGKWLLVRIK